jgi:alkanesulfonate monooxygenase SsuD/methylene tetrahydromethanopterin reductase-like flavin-dependent oxidoreductase (luciferase family)
MTDLTILLESQKGLNWRNWQRFAGAVEDLGYAALYRSEHFVYPAPPDCDSLDLWSSLTWLASHTRRIEFGPLVSPVSVRHPVPRAPPSTWTTFRAGGCAWGWAPAGWSASTACLALPWEK